MNLMSLLGLGSEGHAAAGEPSKSAMGGTGERFQALLVGALGEAGEPVGADAPVAAALPGEATGAVEGEPLPETAREDAVDELMTTALELGALPDPPAEEQRPPIAWAALAGTLVAAAPQPASVASALGMPGAPGASALTQAMAPAELALTEREAPGMYSLGASLPGDAAPSAADLPFLGNPTAAENPAAPSVAAMAPSTVPALAAAAAQEPTGGPGPAEQLAAETAAPEAGALAGAAVAGATAAAAQGAPPAGSPRAAAKSEEGGKDMPAAPLPARESAGRGIAQAAGLTESARPVPAAPRPASPAPGGAAAAAPVAEPTAGGADSAPASLPAVPVVASAPAGDESWSAAEPTGDEPAQPREAIGMLQPKAAAGRLQAASLEGGAAAPEPSLRSAEVPERALRILRELRADGAQQYRAELRLDPPGLGRVRIDFELIVKGEGDAQHALTRITVETAAAHEQLQAELPRIRALLAEQGLGGAEVELHLRQGQGQGAHEQQAQRSPWQRAEKGEHELGSRQLGWRSTHDGLIDLRA